ncbi:MAG: pyridoxamine 5'-phosphate oxidase family protein [Acidobacteriota bacterium]
MEGMKRACLELIASCPDVVVTTIGADSYPQTRVMFNLHGPRYPELQEYLQTLDGEFRIFLGTNTSSSKVRDVRACSRASLFFCRPETYFSLMLAGDLTIEEDPALRRTLWRPGWEIYYPAGYTDPDYTILRFEPRYGRGWNGSANYFLALQEQS